MKGSLARAAPYALVLAVAGVLYHFARRIEYIGPPERLGPDFWPRAVLALLAAVCAYEIGKSFFAAGGSSGGLLQAYFEKEDTRPPSAARLLAGIGATAAYVALVDVLGFFLASAAFIAAFIAIGGYRRWGVVAACSLGGSLAMVIVFMKVVYVSLPLGAGPFRAVSLGLLELIGAR